jgi:hypothetical protein
MDHRRTSWVVGTAALMVGLSMAHVLEDFVNGVPARFGFETAPAALLVGLAYAVHIVFIALAARDRVLGYMGNLGVGAFWLIVAAADHLEDVLFLEPYRAGVISKALVSGLMLAALALAVISLLAWRSWRTSGRRESRRSQLAGPAGV